jgi:hypothetical protein
VVTFQPKNSEFGLAGDAELEKLAVAVNKAGGD